MRSETVYRNSETSGGLGGTSRSPLVVELRNRLRACAAQGDAVLRNSVILRELQNMSEVAQPEMQPGNAKMAITTGRLVPRGRVV